MALSTLTKSRALWTTFKLKTAQAVSRSLYEKLVENGLSVKDFGAKGDGITDDTVAIQNAINYTSLHGIRLYVPASDKPYMVNALRSTDDDGTTVHIHGLVTKDNSNIYFEKGAYLKVIANSALRYCALLVRGTNVSVYYPTIVGDRDEHITISDPSKPDGYDGEWGYGLRVDLSAKDVYIHKPHVTKCWGDSYIIITDNEDVTLYEPFGAFSRRQGLSVIRGKGLKVVRPLFEDISGAWPQSGIDIEPDLANEQVEIEIESPTIRRTGGYCFEMNFTKQDATSSPISVIVTGYANFDNWMRLITSEGVTIDNYVRFDHVKTRRIVSYNYSQGTLFSFGRAVCEEVPIVYLNDAPTLPNYGRLEIEDLLVTEDATYAYTLANSGDLSAGTYDKVTIDINRLRMSYGKNISKVNTTSRNGLPFRVGEADDIKATLAGSSLTINFYDHLYKEVIFNKTNLNTTLSVTPNLYPVGTDVTLRGLANNVTLTPSGAETINGLTDPVTLYSPFLATFRAVGSSDYELEIKYNNEPATAP